MDDDSLVESVLRTVAVHADKQPEELPPLNDTVDPDALATVFGRRPDGTPRLGAGWVEFDYAGYRVTVTSDGDVDVEPFEDG